MARRKPDLRRDRAADDQAVEKRIRLYLLVLFPACDPPHNKPRLKIRDQVSAEAFRVRELGLPAGEQLAAVEVLMDELGVLDYARQRADSIEGNKDAPCRASRRHRSERNLNAERDG